MYHGWVQGLSYEQRRANELRSVLAYCLNDPSSPYWRARLFGLLKGTQAPALLPAVVPAALSVIAATFAGLVIKSLGGVR